MKVRLSENAERDLQSIFEYLWGESPRAAMSVLEELESASMELGTRPMLYPLVRWHEETGIRRRLVGAYSIYYLVEGDSLQVLQVLHSARDHERLLFPED